MSLLDTIEELGAAVDLGLLDRPTAVRLLAEGSNGGLTEFGADDMLSCWQTARAEYAEMGMVAEMWIAAIDAAMREEG